jgi:hypothetical protein
VKSEILVSNQIIINQLFTTLSREFPQFSLSSPEKQGYGTVSSTADFTTAPWEGWSGREGARLAVGSTFGFRA